MDPSLELAGIAAAQAVCCLFDRVPLVPLAFSRRAAGPPTVTLLSGGTPERMTAESRQWLDMNMDQADEAVVLFDGYITIPEGRKDAIILELRSYGDRVRHMRMAVPYRPHHDPRGFAVHRPKFIVATPEGHDMSALRESFFRGVAIHKVGRQIWDACVDESW
jgi:hypothetical protein